MKVSAAFDNICSVSMEITIKKDFFFKQVFQNFLFYFTKPHKCPLVC